MTDKITKEQLESWYNHKSNREAWIEAEENKEEEEVCEFCGGTGIEILDEDDGEGHIMRGVGERKCICQIKEVEYNDQDK